MISHKIFKLRKPLFFDGDSLITANDYKVFTMDLSFNEKLLFKFRVGFISKVLNKFSLLYRLRRAGVGAAIQHRANYFLTFDRKLFRYNPKVGLNVEHEFINGRGPLQYCNADGIEGFDDTVYFGEYFGNHARNSVDIYKRLTSGEWSVVFTFPKGVINHIHALVPDSYRNCIWILAGDFEHSASIWIASNDFKEVEPVVNGEQVYRACVAFPVEDGLVYATDTQLAQNSIQKMTMVDGVWKSKTIFEINGSCIYGCEIKDYFVFSSSTEPAPNPKSFLKGLLDNKPAPVIKKNQSDVILCSKRDFSCSVLRTSQKDRYPYRLFQFGTIMFPAGKNNSNLLFTYNIGSVKNDLSTELIELD